MTDWWKEDTAPLIPRAKDCRSCGEREVVDGQAPSNRLTKVNIGKTNTVSPGSNPGSVNNLLV